MEETKRPVSELLAKGLLRIRFEDLDQRSVQIAKDKILDCIGNMAGGVPLYGNQELLEVVRQYGSREEAPIFFFGGRASFGDAAMMNAVSCRSNDFDAMFMNLDGKHLPSKVSGTLYPSALTMADQYGLSGKETITNCVAADDLCVRIIGAGGRWSFPLGWDSSFTMPIFGVIAQLARVKGLSEEQLQDAWGLGYNMLGGTLSNIFDYATSCKLGQGYSARNADFCVRLAQKGWSAIKNPFEGPRNYYKQYRGMEEACEPSLLRDGYGRRFFMEETIKLYPVGSPATPFAFAGQKLYAQGLKVEDVASVELAIAEDYTGLYYMPEFELGRDPVVHAQYSYQFAACVCMLHGAFSIRNYNLEVIKDPVLLELISKSKIVRDPSLPSGTVAVRVTKKDGAIEEQVQGPGGFSMHDYPTREQLLGKYWDQIDTYGLLTKARAQKVVDLVDRLEELNDLRELTTLLMP